jgi:hypothetical protein
MLRIAACAIMGLGAALLIAALLLSTYTAGNIAKIPLDIDTTLVSDGTGAALDPASLSGEHFVIDQDVPLVSQQQLEVESPANADVVTLQAGTSVRRADKQKDNGLLLAIVDTVTLNRTTAMAVSDDTHPGGAVQKPRTFEDDNPPTNIALPHEGLSYRFPFHTKKVSYQYFDPVAQKAFDANYDDEDDVNGLTTYRFTQNVGYDAQGDLTDPVKYASLYPHDEDGEVTASAKMWNLTGEGGVEGEGEEAGDPYAEITMTRYYAAQRTLWVDPVSGVIVKAKVHANHYFARDPLKPEATLTEYTVISNEETIETQVNTARNERDRVALWSRILPITFTAAGLISLIGGALLGWFGLQTESALIDPGLDTAEHGFFGGFSRKATPTTKTPGAEAETEKLSTRRPDQSRDAGPADAGPPERDASGPADQP